MHLDIKTKRYTWTFHLDIYTLENKFKILKSQYTLYKFNIDIFEIKIHNCEIEINVLWFQNLHFCKSLFTLSKTNIHTLEI